MNFTNYLSSINGVDIYPLMAFVAFFTFFICMTIWTFKSDKQRMKTLSELPLHDESPRPSQPSNEKK